MNFIRNLGKSIVNGFKNLIDLMVGKVTETAADAVMTVAPVAPAVVVPAPTRRRKAGPVRPAGSKLARKAAEGKLGLATIR